MYVFGGFAGVLLNDVLVYRPPSCQAFLAEEGCVKAGPGVRCIWSRGRCLPWEPSMANGSLFPAPFCPPKAGEKDIQTFSVSSGLLLCVQFHHHSTHTLIPALCCPSPCIFSHIGRVVLPVLRLCQLYGQHQWVPVVWWQEMHLCIQQLYLCEWSNRGRQSASGLVFSSQANTFFFF